MGGVDTCKRGREAEMLAACFLEHRGLRVTVRNYRCSRGELDLVAQEGLILVFVEVRLRTGGHAADSLDARKCRYWVRAARHYLAHCAPGMPICRFDAIFVDGQTGLLEWRRDVIWL